MPNVKPWRTLPPKLVWFVGLRKNNKTYYVTRVNLKKSTVDWSVNRKTAIQFTTESGVHQFIDTYLGGRNDVVLVHAPEDD